MQSSESYQIETLNIEMNDFINNYQLPPKYAADTQHLSALDDLHPEAIDSLELL